MKKIVPFLLLFILFACNQNDTVSFPGAEGYGAEATGGRGGKLYTVDNLNDSGPGSLREAVEAEGARTVIFNVCGNIELENFLVIKNPDITIAGQTAPGQGICLKNYSLVVKETQNVIVRGLHIRPGLGAGLFADQIDGIEIFNSERIIIDHCSVSWAGRNNLNAGKGNKYMTIQWCIFSEPLYNDQANEYGLNVSFGGEYISFHHNLIAHGAARNPQIKGNEDYPSNHISVSNNVIFNYKDGICEGNPLTANFINNFIKVGSATSEETWTELVRITESGSKWHMAGNELYGFKEITENNWDGGVIVPENTSLENVRSKKAFPILSGKLQSAQEAYDFILDNAGASPGYRDAPDRRIVDEVKEGIATYRNGLVSDPDHVGGHPRLRGDVPRIDSDKDGIPDDWEKNSGLHSGDPSDANKVAKNGYTNLENWINSLLPSKY